MRASRLICRALLVALALAAVLGATAAPAGAIARDEIIARAKVWVTANTPYSQSRYAYANGALVPVGTTNASYVGWRTDCSGFVSMAWALRDSQGRCSSLSTSLFPLRSSVSTTITKDQLLPGDAINAPGYHAVIFGGWANPQRTEYWTYEESNSQSGAVSRKVPYPFWPSPGTTFTPRRLVGVTESGNYSDVTEGVSGADRFATAVAASKKAFPADTVSTVIIANGDSWADALGGAALAGAVNGPLLLTRADALPAATAAEIVRFAPDTVWVLGGSSVVSTDVVTAIDKLAGVANVWRLGGVNRYETAEIVAAKAVSEGTRLGRASDKHVYLATGADFPDALAASPVSAYKRRPILLVPPEGIRPQTIATLKAIGATDAHILGGSGVVPSSVEASLTGVVLRRDRIAGTSRYDTAAALARHSITAGCLWGHAGVASGVSFADALAGGVSQGLTRSVLLLTAPDVLPGPSATELALHRTEIVKARVFGGTGAVNNTARAGIAAALR